MMSDNRFLEIRTYKLRPGTRAEFDRTFREGALPLLARHGITVVGYGPSVHDDLGYYLMRAYPSLERRQELLDRFYNSEEWVQNYDAPVMALIDQYSTVVIPATAELVAQLEAATAH
jgi:hypothetical protein